MAMCSVPVDYSAHRTRSCEDPVSYLDVKWSLRGRKAMTITPRIQGKIPALLHHRCSTPATSKVAAYRVLKICLTVSMYHCLSVNHDSPSHRSARAAALKATNIAISLLSRIKLLPMKLPQFQTPALSMPYWIEFACNF